MQKIIENLVALQTVDTKLYEIEMLRGDLPKQVESLKAELNELQEEIDSDKLSVKTFQSERSDLENEQTLNAEKLVKYQDQLYKATSNREYEATSSQIEFCEQETNRIKTRMTEIDLKVLELEEGLKPKEEKLSALQNDFKEREGELNKKVEETAKEESELKGKRSVIVPLIRKDIVNKYERIRTAKNGLAVAPIIRDCCGGCFNQVPPQIIIELRKRDAIRTCEFCGRIMYYETTEEATVTHT